MRQKKSNQTGIIVLGVLAVLVCIFAIFAILVGYFLLTRSVDNDPFRAEAIPDDKPFPSLSYGIQTFVWWDSGQAGVHLDWVRLLSFSYVKQIFPWDEIEPREGEWDFSQSDRIVGEIERRELKLIVRLTNTPEWALVGDIGDAVDSPPADYDHFASFCREIATRYRGRIAGYQVWNEPNLTREWGNQPPNAQDYTSLLEGCSTAIRAVDPEAIIISAGLAPTGTYNDIAHPDDIYLQAMYNMNFQEYADVVGVHTPGFSAPTYGPNDAEADGQGRWATFRRIEDLRQIMIENDDASRQMAILELGWTTDQVHPAYQWFAVDEETQSKNLVEAYKYALENWSPWVGLVSMIYLPDITWTEDNEELWWAISHPTKGHRPAYFALANMPKTCDDFVIPERDPSGPEALGIVPATICP